MKLENVAFGFSIISLITALIVGVYWVVRSVTLQLLVLTYFMTIAVLGFVTFLFLCDAVGTFAMGRKYG